MFCYLGTLNELKLKRGREYGYVCAAIQKGSLGMIPLTLIGRKRKPTAMKCITELNNERSDFWDMQRRERFTLFCIVCRKPS